jgi:hypothetical protein
MCPQDGTQERELLSNDDLVLTFLGPMRLSLIKNLLKTAFQNPYKPNIAK